MGKIIPFKRPNQRYSTVDLPDDYAFVTEKCWRHTCANTKAVGVWVLNGMRCPFCGAEKEDEQ